METADLIGATDALTITGEVQTRRTNERPTISVAKPQGISPVSLILDLAIEHEGEIGGEIVTWRPVEHRQSISAHQYRDVLIRGVAGEQKLKVEQTLS